MSDDRIVGDDEFGRDLRAAVRRLERSTSPDPGVRARAADRMREAYADRATGVEPSVVRAEAELTTLIDEDLRVPDRTRWLPAAAAVIVVLGLGALVWSVRGDESAPVTDDPTVSTIAATPDEPRLLGAGTITTDVLGPRLTLTSTEPLWLLRSGTGVVELGFGDDPSDTNTMTIVRHGDLDPSFGVDELEPLLDQLPGSQEESVIVAGRAVLSWRLLDVAGTDLCSPTCRPLFVDPPAVTLRSDRIVDVVEVPLGPDVDAVLISTTEVAEFAADGSGAFTEIIRSMEIEETSPVEDPPDVPEVDVRPIDPES